MTGVETRQEIFSKDYLTIKDIMFLVGLSYSKASQLMLRIKYKYDRLHIRGKLAVQDYLDYYGYSSERYVLKENGNEKN